MMAVNDRGPNVFETCLVCPTVELSDVGGVRGVHTHSCHVSCAVKNVM